jgi:hypothetical protein
MAFEDDLRRAEGLVAEARRNGAPAEGPPHPFTGCRRGHMGKPENTLAAGI